MNENLNRRETSDDDLDLLLLEIWELEAKRREDAKKRRSAEPAKPAEAQKPAEPAKPAAPVKPAAPAKPAEAPKPAEPVKPAEPLPKERKKSKRLSPPPQKPQEPVKKTQVVPETTMAAYMEEAEDPLPAARNNEVFSHTRKKAKNPVLPIEGDSLFTMVRKAILILCAVAAIGAAVALIMLDGDLSRNISEPAAEATFTQLALLRNHLIFIS